MSGWRPLPAEFAGNTEPRTVNLNSLLKAAQKALPDARGFPTGTRYMVRLMNRSDEVRHFEFWAEEFHRRLAEEGTGQASETIQLEEFIFIKVLYRYDQAEIHEWHLVLD